MRAYYGSRFSKNMTLTPDGFLVCHNVPIARTGWYEYTGDEIGVPEKSGQIVKVYRSPEEVFSDAAMASFEGKPACDEHPPDAITPENATRYAKGVAQNVRQGKGEDADLLLADLVIYDQMLINEIQDGKREVSCGYDCVYAPMDDGTYQQQQICGNHVAVVQKGRAGNRVAIQDSKTKVEGAKQMNKKIRVPKKNSRFTDVLAAIGLKQFATDAEPEEIMDAVNALAEEKGAMDDESNPNPTPAPNPAPTNDQPQDPALAALSEQVSKLTEIVSKLVQGAQQPQSPEDAIDAAINELEGQTADDDDQQESHTIPAAAMDEPGPVSNPEDRPDNPLPGQDNGYKIAALRAIKPILAAIPDVNERKKAADAAIASIKGRPAKNTYANIQRGQVKAVKDQAKETQVTDYSQLGRKIAEMRNPHYKKDHA